MKSLVIWFLTAWLAFMLGANWEHELRCNCHGGER